MDIDFTLDMKVKSMAKALRGVQATQPNLALEEQLKIACKQSGMQLITFLTEVLMRYEKTEEETGA